MNSKDKLMLKTLFVILIYIITATIKFFLGFKYILIIDGIMVLASLIIVGLYFLFGKTGKFFKAQIYTSLIYGFLGILLPSFEYIGLNQTLFSGLTYVLPALFFMIMVKRHKNKQINENDI